MGFAAHQAALDEAAFDHLADDAAGSWTPRGGQALAPVRVMLDDVERPAELGQMRLIQKAHAVRVLATELEALAPGLAPGEGDAFLVNGRVKVVRGQPWREGSDWVCLVSDA